MKELQMNVQQTPGVIRWNFEELKAQLQEEMSTYETTVYTEENIMEAKSDLAMLRKFRKSVEDRRKEIKNKCLEPYALVESQAKELTSLIDKPIALISEKVTEYDEKQREERKKRILEYMNEKFSRLPNAISYRLKFKCYDQKWENASTAVKDWKTAIDAAAESCMADITKLNESVDAEFLPDAMKIYGKNLEIAEAERAFNQYLQHKVQILEAEQRKKEEEQRRQRAEQERAIRQAEERARAEEAARIRREQEAARMAQTEQKQAQAEELTEEPKKAIYAPIPNQHNSVCEQFESEIPYAILRIQGTHEQIVKVKGYARYCGASVEVLEES